MTYVTLVMFSRESCFATVVQIWGERGREISMFLDLVKIKSTYQCTYLLYINQIHEIYNNRKKQPSLINAVIEIKR